MKILALITGAFVNALVLTQPAHGEIVTYEISNPSNDRANGMVAGDGGTPDPYWRFLPGSTFELDTHAGIGSLSATLVNNLGVPAPLELEFSGLLDTLDGTGFYYLQGQGGSYDPGTQDYLTTAAGTFDYQPFGESFIVNQEDSISGNSVFQFGEGANYHNPNTYGFAAWLEFIHPINGTSVTWDIYGVFHPRHSPTDVPEPAPLALLGLGLAGLVTARRRRRKSAAA